MSFFRFLFPVLLGAVLLPGLRAQTSADGYFFRRQAHDGMILLRNAGSAVPILDLSGERWVVVSLGTRERTPFQEMLLYYTDLEWVSLDYRNGSAPFELAQLLRTRSRVILCWHNESAWQGLSATLRSRWEATIQDEIDAYQRALVVVMGPESALTSFPGLPNAGNLLLASGDSRTHEQLAAQIVMGAESCSGRLSKDVSSFFLKGNGLRINGGLRLSYTFPEAVGWSGADLSRRVDSVVLRGIEGKAFPGCQVLIAKEGKVIFHKAYGHHTYNQETAPVSDLDVYDLASITKVTGPLPVLMSLYDQSVISLDAPFASCWPEFFGTDKQEFTLREALAHQAGLVPYIVFYRELQKGGGGFRGRTIRADSSSSYPVKVYERMYLHKRWRKKMWEEIRDTALLAERKYVYSDLSFMLYPDMIRRLTGRSYEDILSKDFLTPLGASRMCYNPWQRTGMENIVPTEYDSLFRRSLVAGYVHDENAALLGGVSGHAGLFASSHDLSKMLQMYLNGGQYGGKRYLSQEVLEEFTRYQFEGNRRGLGFDKPLREPGSGHYIAPEASAASYGHSGFTGTFFWIDPQEELILIFLSNRVYPTRKNRGLYDLGIREALHGICYHPKSAIWKN